MKIGIDIDDTTTETFENILPFLCEYYNLDENFVKQSKKNNEKLIENLKDYNIFARKYYPNIIPFLPLKKDAKKYINKLKETNEIYFITARSTLGYDDSYKISYEYLKNTGINFDKLIVAAGNKRKACEELGIDILIDDSINNCLEVEKTNKTKVILFGNEYNINNNSNLKRLDSWKKIYEYITKG